MLSENFACGVVVLILRCHLDVLNLSIPFQLVRTCGFNISCFGSLEKFIVRCSEIISDSEILEAIPVVCVLIGGSCVLDWR